MPAAEHPEAQLGVDGIDGDFQLLGDGLVRKAVETAENEDFAAAGRQGTDGLVENFDFLVM